MISVEFGPWFKAVGLIRLTVIVCTLSFILTVLAVLAIAADHPLEGIGLACLNQYMLAVTLKMIRELDAT